MEKTNPASIGTGSGPYGRHATLLFLLMVILTAGQGFPQEAVDQTLKDKYQAYPAEIQAHCALYKLDRLLEQKRAGGEDKDLTKLEEGRKWLASAVENYDKIAAAGISGDEAEPARSPLGLMQHLWRAQEGMHQRLASFQVSSTPAGYDALNATFRQAVADMDKAVAALEAARGWKEVSDGMFLSIQVPPGFWPRQNISCRLFFNFRPPPNYTEVTKALYVTVEPNKENKPLRDYQLDEIVRERQNYPDAIMLESDQAYPGVRGRWFQYAYTWEGKEIFGVMYHVTNRRYIWEIKYIALVDSFDEEECEGIIRSVQIR
jgi:hypothetical protein